jgi:transposase
MDRNGRLRRNLSTEECAVVVAFSEEGESQQSIARCFGVTQSTISRVLNRFREIGANTRRLDQGRKRVTNAAQERFLRIQTLRQ